MRPLDFGRIALCSSVAAALLAACGAAQPPIGVSGAKPSAARTSDGSTGRSGTRYMYVDTVSSGVDVRTFPAGKQIRSLPYGGWPCVDPNTANVYVSSGGLTLTEYTPGAAKVIATTTYPAGYTLGPCAVDPTTGNVAVAGAQGEIGINSQGVVLVYHSLYGAPTIYVDSAAGDYYFPGYDPQGDLFLSSNSVLGELAKGEDAFTHLQVPAPANFSGPVQWDGTYMTAASVDRGYSIIYRFAVTGSSLMIIGKTRLNHQKPYTLPCIAGNTVIAPFGKDVLKRHTAYWHYPKAGKRPYEVIKGFNPYFFAVGSSGN